MRGDELVVMSWKDIGYFEVDPMKINRVCSCSRDECKKKKEERGGRRKARRLQNKPIDGVDGDAHNLIVL